MAYSLLGEGFEKDRDKAFSWQFFIHFPGDKERNTDCDCSLIHLADLSWQCRQLVTHIFPPKPLLEGRDKLLCYSCFTSSVYFVHNSSQMHSLCLKKTRLTPTPQW